MTALSGITIIETAERPVGEYCAKLLADFGAEVIKVERPGGAPTRTVSPFASAPDGTQHSIVFAYLNTNKKSVVLDLENARDRATLDRLLAKADALIDDHDEAWAEAHGLTPTAVAAAFPALVHCAITPFGQGAPADWQMLRPINVMNATGWAYHTPSEADPTRPPLKGAGRFMSDYEAGLDAAMAICASLHRKNETGKGQFIDLSQVEVEILRADILLGRNLGGDHEPDKSRTNFDMGGPATAFACKDGFIYIFMTSGAHWKGLCELVGEPWVEAFPPDWLEFHCTKERVTDFRTNFRRWIADKEKDVIAEQAQRLGVTIVPVNSAADLHHNPQFAHRGYFQKLDDPVLGEALYPTVPYKFSRTPVTLRTAAPALGQNDDELAETAVGGR
jgi:crotonobetainyl-CoA:carnitine CoA-transferase CaiB-like acyl-CoA transferase